MKLTKQRLKKIIKEEISAVIAEDAAETFAFRKTHKVPPILRALMSITDRLSILQHELARLTQEFTAEASTGKEQSDRDAHSI
jgi:hypothetical protein